MGTWTVGRAARFATVLVTLVAASAVVVPALAAPPPDELENDTGGVLNLSTGSDDTVGIMVAKSASTCEVGAGASWRVNNDATGVATVSPATLSFTSCDTNLYLTVTGVSPGTARITFTQLTGDSSIAEAGGAFNVVVTDPDDAPSVSSVSPSNGATGVAVNADIVANFSETVSYRGGAITVDCGGAIEGSLSPNPNSSTTSATFNPSAALPLDTLCTATVLASKVSDDDGNDPPDKPVGDFVWSFRTAAGDATPPVVTYDLTCDTPGTGWSDVDGGTTDLTSGWCRGTASIDWTVTDSGSTPTPTGCIDASVTSDTAGTASTCAATSDGGTTGPITVTIKRDGTAPAVTVTPDRGPDHNGWYNAPVTFDTASTDPDVVDTDCTDDQGHSTDGTALTVSGSCTDTAGNTGNGSSDAFQYDDTAPSISASVSPARPGSGWWNIASGAPTVSYVCNDGTSGVSSCEPPHLFGEGADQEHTGDAEDAAGNDNTAGTSDVDVDLTAPTLTWVGGPANGSSHTVGSVPSAPTCTAADSLSGPGACNVAGYSTAVGTHTLTATAYDQAGNSSSEQRSYTVNPAPPPSGLTIGAFAWPVVNGGFYNWRLPFSLTSVPFEVWNGPTEVTSTSAVTGVTYTRIACGTGVAIGSAQNAYSTWGSSLAYQYGRFVFKWRTPLVFGQCYRFTVTVEGGATRSANFQIGLVPWVWLW